MILSPVHQLSLLGRILIGPNHSITGAPHKTCRFGDTLFQLSSHHNFARVEVTQILTVAHFPDFNFENWLLTCYLIYLIP